MAKKKPERKTPKKAGRAPAAARPSPRPAASRLLDLNPDELPLTERRAAYLAELSGVSAKEIVSRKIAEVHEALKWKIDPTLVLFRRICGQVVKRDPVSGELLPVPNATVYVEDTDCSFLGYFPYPYPWVWIYPFNCRREVLGAVRTDSCGRFCINLPLWDVDRILRWRRARICYWYWFRPRLRDILDLAVEPPIFRPPRPLPDPPPISPVLPERIERIRDLAGSAAVDRLQVASQRYHQGGSQAALNAVLDEPLFARSTPPPLPQQVLREGPASLAAAIDLPLEKIDVRRFIGPFLRCHDIYIGQWQTVLDVPDITFRVTQDYDGDGVEEEIYSEGFFDVRWDSGPIPDVTLEASGNALATLQCGPVKEIPCGNVASIEAAGYLDLEPAYHDDVAGFGLRVNRPSPTGLYPPPPVEGVASATPANAPYAGNLNLHGCVRLNDATHYRINQEYRANPSDPWGSAMTLKGITWVAPRQGPGSPIPFVPDADGWYLIQPAVILVHPNWLLPWNTEARADGTYRLELELGRLTGGVINSIGTSAKRVFEVDNSSPAASFIEVRWRPASTARP